MKIKYLSRILGFVVLTAMLSSCLKDNRFIDFAGVGTIVEFPLGGQINFNPDAITETPDTLDNSTIVRQFAVNVASPKIPTTETKITLAVDNSLIAPYNASQTAVVYEPFPADAFKFTNSSVTIPSGQRVAIVSVTFYKAKLDPSKSYMLPIKIANAGGLNISANKGIHYFHIIGNVLAGSYNYDYYRYNNGVGPSAGPPSTGPTPGATATFSPVSPTEITVLTGYLGIPYHLTFKKTGNVISDFAVSFNSDDVAGTGVTITDGPRIKTADPVNGIFEFYFSAKNSAGKARFIDEKFYK
jgi:hypothetical protein